MARSKIYSASSGQSAATTMLVAIIIINVLAIVGQNTIACSTGRLSPDLLKAIYWMKISSWVLGGWTLFSLIKRRATMKPLPLEFLAGILGVFVSLAWAVLYFLSCERML